MFFYLNHFHAKLKRTTCLGLVILPSTILHKTLCKKEEIVILQKTSNWQWTKNEELYCSSFVLRRQETDGWRKFARVRVTICAYCAMLTQTPNKIGQTRHNSTPVLKHEQSSKLNFFQHSPATFHRQINNPNTNIFPLLWCDKCFLIFTYPAHLILVQQLKYYYIIWCINVYHKLFWSCK